jgi:ribosomal protein S27AE
MIRYQDWRPRVPRGTPLLRLLDRVDERVLAHRVYGFCTWLANHPDWRPTSAAHPRPGGKPSYIAPSCPTCGTALVLDDRLRDPALPDDQVWHDEWLCPNCRGGVWMDWPSGEFEARFGD